MICAPDGLDSDFAFILKRADHLWPRLYKSSLFITGGTGFFGRWLLESLHLANQVHQLDLAVTVLTRDPLRFQRQAPILTADPAFTLLAGDVRNFVFPTGNYTHIVHLATTSAHETFAGEDPLSKFDTLVLGTRRVLDFAVACGIQHFLFTSSGVVYQINDEPISEDYLLAPPTHCPDTALGQAKRTAEFLCSYYAAKYNWRFGLARCFSFAGPWLPLDIHYAIGNFISQALRGDPITVNSDGMALRSYLYAADLTVWLLTMLLEGTDGQPCNVGSDAAISIADLAYKIRNLLAPSSAVLILSKPDVSIGNPRRNVYVPNITRARNTLGLDVWTDLSTAIQRTAQHAQAAFW